MKRTIVLLLFVVVLALLASCMSGCTLSEPCTPIEGGIYDGCCWNEWAGEWCCKTSSGWVCNS